MKSSVIRSTDFSDKKVSRRSLSRNILFKVLHKITDGTLVLEDNGEQFVFGKTDCDQSLSAKVTINNPLTYSWMLRSGDLGAAEAYIQGYWDTADLHAVIQLFARNAEVLTGLNQHQSLFSRLSGYLLHLFNKNSLTGSKQNISAHYDLSNDFFSLFLDSTMAYSSAIFTQDDETLEQGSQNKFKHICDRLQLNTNDTLLEIGTGWGGLAIYAARHYGCKVTTTTISEQQYRYAKDLVKSEGLEKQISVIKKDYRELSGKFSKLVSVEMIEAVGPQYYSSFFQRCNELLLPSGLMLIQSITISDQRYAQSIKQTDFIKRYIFPGGQLPSNQIICSHISIDTDMQLVGLEDITLDYAKTLFLWRTNFIANLNKIMALGMDKPFIRKWLYYFCFCEAGFRERMIHTAQFIFAKPGFKNLPAINVN